MTTISRETTLVRCGHLIAAPVENDLVMVDVERGYYYALDDIGTQAWEHLAAPISVAELCTLLLANFDVTPEQCEADVLAFLTELHQEGMVQIVGADAAKTA
jgi:hypothetical protein